jgi:hypothetical protein
MAVVRLKVSADVIANHRLKLPSLLLGSVTYASQLQPASIGPERLLPS